jgi:RNA polymerase sigma factor (sigma-70 family)
VPVTTLETEELSVAHEVLAEELDREERLVLLLFYAEGLSFADIAEVLDLPVATVERLYRATMATLEERLR